MEKSRPGRESRHPKKAAKQQDKKLWKLYMGGVPVSLTEDQLGDILCDRIDNFKVHIMKNQEQGNSKGCGFIEVYTKEDFDYLIKNKIEVEGKTLQIEQYIENEDERKKKMFENNERSIHVGGLPLEADAEDLTKYFGQFGEVKRAYIIYNLGEEKKSRGFGFVEFVSKKSAKKVLQVEHSLMDKLITVTPRHSKKEIKSTKGKDSSKNQSVSGSSISSKNKPAGGPVSSKASSKNSSHQPKPFGFYPSSHKPTAAERGLHERFSPYMREVDGHYFLMHPDALAPQQQQLYCSDPNDAFEPLAPQGPKQAKSGSSDRWEPQTSSFGYPQQQPLYGYRHPQHSADHSARPLAYPGAFGPPHPSHAYPPQFVDAQFPPYPAHPHAYHKKHSAYLDASLAPPTAPFSQKYLGPQFQPHAGYGHAYNADLHTTKSQPNKPSSKPEGFVYDARNGIAPVKPKRDAIKQLAPVAFLTPNVKPSDANADKAFERFSLTELPREPQQSAGHLFQSDFALDHDDHLNEVFHPELAGEDSSEYKASMEQMFKNIEED